MLKISGDHLDTAGMAFKAHNGHFARMVCGRKINAMRSIVVRLNHKECGGKHEFCTSAYRISIRGASRKIESIVVDDACHKYPAQVHCAHLGEKSSIARRQLNAQFTLKQSDLLLIRPPFHPSFAQSTNCGL